MTTVSLSDAGADEGTLRPAHAPREGRWSVMGAIAFTTVVFAASIVAALAFVQTVTTLYHGGNFFDWFAASRLSAGDQQRLAVGAQLLAEVAQLGMILWLAGR